MRRRNILPKTIRRILYIPVLLFLLCSSGIALTLPILSSFACGSRPEGENGKATSLALTLTTIPALKIVSTISTLENATTTLTTATNLDNPGVDNSSEKTWHIVETWSLFLSTVTLFPYKDLLQSLHDVFDKIDDGSDDSDDLGTKLRNNIRTVHNMTARIKRRVHKLHKIGSYLLTRVWAFLFKM